ncbi:ribosomal-protein-alanine acetyltransferase [Salinarchaeum sp. Harcht-Bsk1]|uniref:GNAT family N-acetyltransferase n=1 Tax=Salinarchaeum sp. Harcht-Bsk1 TaxID=1333523 RepID=UPI00034230D9|nr:GNAT family N-acetyltransferase [Salinarchaeum sp. Harcht-Bsk1]AGN01179.1 ribosomal-protein-alanine acetyltransferase [Salinarchaeum sp. Harcht-Bsk1]
MTVTPEDQGVRIRPVERADLLAVHRIERAAFSTPWPFEAFERFVDAPGFLVAVEEPEGAVAASAEGGEATGVGDGAADREGVIGDGGVIGYVVAEVTPNHGRAFGHVKDLAVHPEHRRRGIASTLLERALVTLAGEGATSVKLEVREDNEAAQALYREFGFAPMRRRAGYYEDGTDALVMAREL